MKQELKALVIYNYCTEYPLEQSDSRILFFGANFEAGHFSPYKNKIRLSLCSRGYSVMKWTG